MWCIGKSSLKRIADFQVSVSGMEKAADTERFVGSGGAGSGEDLRHPAAEVLAARTGQNETVRRSCSCTVYVYFSWEERADM